MLPGMELMACPNLAVPREVMHHVVRVESSYNPYAIGVVGGRLVRQPRNLAEAVSTARMLEDRGYNFSLGLAQVNRYNLVKYGLHSYEKAFHPCSNLVAGSQILRECYGRSGGDWGKSFSCYYSGDFKTGYRHGYVQKVYASMRRGSSADSNLAAAAAPIQVVDRAARRVNAEQRPMDSAAPSGTGSVAGSGMSLADRRGARGPVNSQSQARIDAMVVSATPGEGPAVTSAEQVAALQPTQPVASPLGPGQAVPTALARPAVVLQGAPVSAVATQAPSPGDSAFVF